MEGNGKKHFSVGRSKTQILTYILRHEIPVKEHEITEFLKTEHLELNRASVNRHLSDLEDLNCVTKVNPVKKSRFNYWDIEFKNLKNIKEEFPNIQLKDSTNAKSLIIKINFPDIPERLYKKYFVYMSLFPSLFDVFLNNSFKQLFQRANELWKIENYRDQDHKRHILYDKICRHFYETDFLTGKSNEDAKKFVDELEERIKNVNDAYNITPGIENPRHVINFQAAVDELDALYGEWYEKCLKKDQLL